MISDLVNLLFPSSSFVSDVQTWIESILSDSRIPYVDQTTGEVIDHSISSLDLGFSLIPWDNILACIVLCVFIVCLFRFMRSVFCKTI